MSGTDGMQSVRTSVPTKIFNIVLFLNLISLRAVTERDSQSLVTATWKRTDTVVVTNISLENYFQQSRTFCQ